MFEKEPSKRITGQEIIRTEYFRKVAHNFLQDQGRIRELAIPIDMEPSKLEQSKLSSSGQEDTWKTINSMGSCTGPQKTQGMTTKERLAMKKIEEAKKR